MGTIPVRPLGQAGFRFAFGDFVVYVDPYLSDTVERVEGPAFRRLVPPPLAPDEVRDADLVLVSHAHLDHCDPGTLPALAKASPGCAFLGPDEVRRELLRMGIDAARVRRAREEWVPLGHGLRVHPVPAAHPAVEREADGGFRHVGFVLEYEGRRLYHAGDTRPDAYLLAELERLAPLHVALLPVNERNYFKQRLGIVGNMSVREAFGMAEELGVETLVPIHWDMFAPNSVHREEIEFLYERTRPGFALAFEPEAL